MLHNMSLNEILFYVLIVGPMLLIYVVCFYGGPNERAHTEWLKQQKADGSTADPAGSSPTDPSPTNRNSR